MAIDSLYGAVLKLLYPFEFYTTMLNIYTEKGNLEKIASIISEMRAYRGINLKLGRYGNDNRSWLIDKENNTISQSITGIKYCNENVAEALNKMKDLKKVFVIQKATKWESVYNFDDIVSVENTDTSIIINLKDGAQDIHDSDLITFELELNSFANILRYLQMATSLTTKHIEILIRLNYFEQFGSPNKLLDINARFNKGEMSVSKTIKSWQKRLDALNTYEQMYIDDRANVVDICRAENEYVGISVSYDERLRSKYYMITAIDDKYGIKINLYNITKGTSGTVKMSKKVYQDKPLSIGDVIHMDKIDNRERKRYVDGKAQVGTGIYDVWLKEYSIYDAIQKESA